MAGLLSYILLDGSETRSLPVSLTAADWSRSRFDVVATGTCSRQTRAPTLTVECW